jgi:hypothetical protein
MAGSRRDRHDEPLPDLSRPENRHEHRDVNIRAVYKFGLALTSLCLVAVALLFGLYRYFVNREGGPLAHDRTNVDASALPPAPRLQAAPIADMQDMLRAEDQILNGYGWIDQSKGVARIPIGRAIDLLAQRGVPSRPQGEAPAATNVTVPTESGLGPKVHRPGGPLGSGPDHAPTPAGGHK